MAPSLKAKILNYDNLTMSENAKKQQPHTLCLTHTYTFCDIQN